VFYVQKAYDKARPNFEKAVELEKDPTRSSSYRLALGWIYLNAKQYDKAKDEFTKALEANPGLAGAKEGLQELGARTTASSSSR
jgi:tetratricopeptide (TPR) repeat protein